MGKSLRSSSYATALTWLEINQFGSSYLGPSWLLPLTSRLSKPIFLPVNNSGYQTKKVVYALARNSSSTLSPGFRLYSGHLGKALGIQRIKTDPAHWPLHQYVVVVVEFDRDDATSHFDRHLRLDQAKSM